MSRQQSRQLAGSKLVDIEYGNSPGFVGTDGTGVQGNNRPQRDTEHKVEVNVHGQARQVEDEQVQGRAALECQPTLEERVTPETLQQVEKVDGLLQDLGAE